MQCKTVNIHAQTLSGQLSQSIQALLIAKLGLPDEDTKPWGTALVTKPWEMALEGNLIFYDSSILPTRRVQVENEKISPAAGVHSARTGH